MADILILDLGAVKGNCTIDKYADKVIVQLVFAQRLFGYGQRCRQH
jgi:hypothetical protein